MIVLIGIKQEKVNIIYTKNATLIMFAMMEKEE